MLTREAIRAALTRAPDFWLDQPERKAALDTAEAYRALVERVAAAANAWDETAREADSPEGRRSAERRASNLRYILTGEPQ